MFVDRESLNGTVCAYNCVCLNSCLYFLYCSFVFLFYVLVQVIKYAAVMVSIFYIHKSLVVKHMFILST